MAPGNNNPGVAPVNNQSRLIKKGAGLLLALLLSGCAQSSAQPNNE
jgi:hypothetical protein